MKNEIKYLSVDIARGYGNNYIRTINTDLEMDGQSSFKE